MNILKEFKERNYSDIVNWANDQKYNSGSNYIERMPIDIAIFICQAFMEMGQYTEAIRLSKGLLDLIRRDKKSDNKQDIETDKFHLLLIITTSYGKLNKVIYQYLYCCLLREYSNFNQELYFQKIESKLSNRVINCISIIILIILGYSIIFKPEYSTHIVYRFFSYFCIGFLVLAFIFPKQIKSVLSILMRKVALHSPELSKFFL